MPITYTITQATYLCFPVCMIIRRETKENIRVLKDLYNELETFEDDATKINNEYKPMCTTRVTCQHNGTLGWGL
jgi:hypothetical protein